MFLQQLSTRKKGIINGGWEIHIFGVKVLNLLEMPEIIHFFHICGIHIIYIFSSINGAYKFLNLNMMLLVLNLFCCKILCIYLCSSISVSNSHIVIIFFDCLHLACCCFWIILNFLNIWASLVLTKYVRSKKIVKAEKNKNSNVGRGCPYDPLGKVNYNGISKVEQCI